MAVPGIFCPATLNGFRRCLNLFLTTLNDLNYGFTYISGSCTSSSPLDLYPLLYLEIGSLPPPTAYPSKYSNCGGLEIGTGLFPTDREDFPQEDSFWNHRKYARKTLKAHGRKIPRLGMNHYAPWAQATGVCKGINTCGAQEKPVLPFTLMHRSSTGILFLCTLLCNNSLVGTSVNLTPGSTGA